jgi:hypothetical protein
VRQYRRFCDINRLNRESITANLPFFIAQQLRAGLGPRTIKGYTRKLMSFGSAYSERFSARRLLCVLSKHTIGVHRRHAEDFTPRSLSIILLELRLENEWGGVVGTWMLVTGLRYLDLQYLDLDAIDLTLDQDGMPIRIRIDVNRTKAIRSEILRTELVITRRYMPDWNNDEQIRGAIQKAMNWVSTRRTVALAPGRGGPGDVDAFNEMLRKVWSNRTGRAPTSYSFRRAAFRRFIDLNRKGGVVNWARVALFSLHLDPKTVKAFYHLGVKGEKSVRDDA